MNNYDYNDYYKKFVDDCAKTFISLVPVFLFAQIYKENKDLFFKYIKDKEFDELIYHCRM